MPRKDERDASVFAAAGGPIWVLIGGAVCAAMAPLEPNLLEEGLMLHVAERMLAGQHLYRDVILVTGPFPFALVATMFALFGKQVLAARAAVVVLQALACGSVFGLARRAGRGANAHAAAACIAAAPVLLFPLPSTMFYTTVCTSLTLIAAYLALRGTRSVAWAIAAGAVVALAAISKQTVGAALALGLLPAVGFGAPRGTRGRQLLALAGGGLLVAAVTLGSFAALGDLGVFVSSMLARPRGSAFGVSFINFWPPGRLTPERLAYEWYYVPETMYLLRGGRLFVPPPLVLVTQLMYAAPFLAVAATALRRAFAPLPTGVWMHTCAFLALLTNLFPRSDSGHLVFVLPAALAQLFLLAPSPRGLRGWLLPGAALAALAAGSGFVGSRLHALSVPAGYGPRVPLRVVSPPKQQAVPRVIQFLRERVNPGEPIFVARAEPLLYFATDTRNPTPFTGTLQVWGIRKEQEPRILEALADVRFVVMSDVDEPLHTFFRDELPEVQAYLERHFRVAPPFVGRPRKDGWMLVLERSGDRGPTALDLLDPALAPRAWTRDENGRETGAPGPRLDLPTRQNRRPLAVALGPGGGGVDYELVVPGRARFEADLGLRRIHKERQPDRLSLRVEVSVEGGPFEELARESFRFGRRDRGRVWRPLRIDLSRYAGRRVTLRLEAVPQGRWKPGRYAFWGSPRIAIPAAP